MLWNIFSRVLSYKISNIAIEIFAIFSRTSPHIFHVLDVEKKHPAKSELVAELHVVAPI